MAQEIPKEFQLDENDKRLLREYSIEIHNDVESLTLKLLIDSHRTIRTLRLEVQSERQKYFKDGYDQGFALGMQDIKNDLVAIRKIKEMTIGELANLVNYADED